MAADKRYTEPYQQTPASGDIEPLDGVRRLGDLQRLALQPGDVLVVACPGHLAPEEHARIEAGLHHFFPTHTVLILEAGMTLGAIATEE